MLTVHVVDKPVDYHCLKDYNNHTHVLVTLVRHTCSIKHYNVNNRKHPGFLVNFTHLARSPSATDMNPLQSKHAT